MDVQGINGFNGVHYLTDGNASVAAAKSAKDSQDFQSLVEEMKRGAGQGVASSQIGAHRLNGDYTQGFAGYYTSERDKMAKPQGFAANTTNSSGKAPVIDKTSELYAQSMEMENYFVKMMLSSARKTIQKSDLFGAENSYARDMYEDMMYDNYAEQLTKSGNFGIADAIYIELSGQR